MALVFVGLKCHSASQFWGFGLCLHSDTQESWGSLHRVLLVQSTQAFGTCLPAWCSVQALLLGSWPMHQDWCWCNPGAAASLFMCLLLLSSEPVTVTCEPPWMGPLEILISTGATTNSSRFGPAHLHWHSSRAAPLGDDKSPIQGGLTVKLPSAGFLGPQSEILTYCLCAI